VARTSITQVNNVGVESTPGTAVAANKRLQSLSFMLNPNPEVQTFRPSGTKYPTVAALGKEWAEISLEGQPTFDEVIYALSSVLTTAVVTTPGGGTTSRDWTFSPSTASDDTPKTFTIEQGSSVRAHRCAYSILTGLTVSYENGRENVSIDGEGIGRAIEDGVTLTAGPASLPLVPILAKDTTFYLDTTSAGLGTTILGGTPGAVGAEISVSNRYGPRWGYNAAVPSYSEHLELEPDVTVKFTVEANAAGMGYLTNLRAGDTRFFRAETLGPTIEAAIKYKLRWDCAIKFDDIGDFSDEDGLYAIEFTGRVVHDATWTRAMQVVVTNTQTAL
jgi:hypothetical protein